MTYYHVTFAALLPKIRRGGIVPGKRRNWNNVFGSKLGSTGHVYVFTDPVAAGRWAFKMEWEFQKPAVIIVLDNLNDIEFENDPGAEAHIYVNDEPTWKRTTEVIPASAIERVVPMTQEIARTLAKVNKGETNTLDL